MTQRVGEGSLPLLLLFVALVAYVAWQLLRKK